MIWIIIVSILGYLIVGLAVALSTAVAHEQVTIKILRLELTDVEFDPMTYPMTVTWTLLWPVMLVVSIVSRARGKKS